MKSKMKYQKVILIVLFTLFSVMGCGHTISPEDQNPLNPIPNLKLGHDALQQSVIMKRLSAGMTHYMISRGYPSEEDFFTLSSPLLTGEGIYSMSQQLNDAGYNFEIIPSAEPGPNGETLGSQIQIGRFKDQGQAENFKLDNIDELKDFSVRFTAESGHKTTGPFQVSLLEVDLKQFRGKVFSALAKGTIKGLATPSEITASNDAIASVNGGYFAWNDNVGVAGDPAGISIINGRLVSESISGRPALILNNGKKTSIDIYEEVNTNLKLLVGDQAFEISGINRIPGKVLNCGSSSDPNINFAIHDFVCQNENEIVVINSMYGEAITLTNGLVIHVEADQVKSINVLNGETTVSIPKNGFLINATGSFTELLSIDQGSIVKLDIKVLSEESKMVNLDMGTYAINGGPLLVSNGNVVINNRPKEGWDVDYVSGLVSDEFVDKKDDLGTAAASSAGAAINELNRADFYHSWVVRRHPRTAVGITKDNRAYVMTIYGRQPGVSAGASITEVAEALVSLGSETAINLDGGGSAIMIVDGKATGSSSDEDGERMVSDVLLFKSE